MSAVLDVGDLYFPAVGVALSHLQDVPRVNPAYATSSLALPPIPDFPEPRLNRLFWPVTGLSLYAIGHVLVANDTAATSATGVTLSLTDAAADAARTLSLTVLNRRPLSDTRVSLVTSPSGSVINPFDGWVLTLVDDRYLRRKLVASGDAIARSTWGELINALGTAAGFTMQSASTIQALVHADFGAPDATAWSATTLAGEGYSVAADAAAHGCGLRLVVATDGTVTAQIAATSEAAYAAWLVATGRDEFSSGGITADRYAAPLYVQCDGVDVALPSPTPRMTDRDAADLPSTGSSFRTAWVQAYSDWLAATSVTADVRGFVLPPVCGTIQHVEYDLPACATRVVKHPSRYPLPLMVRDRVGSGGSNPCAGTASSVNFLTNQCTDGYGVVTNEYRTLSISSDGCVSVGPKWCEVAPTCCPEPGADVTSPCCPGVPLPRTLYATISGRGTYPLAYTGSYWRIDANWPDCAGGGFLGDWILYLQCSDLIGPDPTADTWTINGNGFSLRPADEVRCDPLRLVFLDVPIMIGGGPCAANLYDVVIEL